MSRFAKRERAERREFLDRLAVLGSSLIRVRDQRLYEREGFGTFDEFCQQRLVGMLPDWKLTADQAFELAAMAIELAEKRTERGRPCR